MKVVLQRSKNSKVTVDNNVCGSIDKGLVLLSSFNNNDTKEVVDKMINKIINLRIFDDSEGKMNLSLLDVNGKVLNISQFTLYADSTHGNRPSFVNAAKFDIAKSLYDYMNEKIKELGIINETGIFGADMKLEIYNDGPVTIILDSDEIF